LYLVWATHLSDSTGPRPTAVEHLPHHYATPDLSDELHLLTPDPGVLRPKSLSPRTHHVLLASELASGDLTLPATDQAWRLRTKQLRSITFPPRGMSLKNQLMNPSCASAGGTTNTPTYQTTNAFGWVPDMFFVSGPMFGPTLVGNNTVTLIHRHHTWQTDVPLTTLFFASIALQHPYTTNHSAGTQATGAF